jgi:hypothetical protein
MAMREMVFGGRAVLTEAVPTGMQKMAALMWAPMLLMGLMIVFASLGLSVVKASFASDYFGVEKAIREGANANLIDKRQFIESVNVWLPGFQLLGIGLILSAITFSLANILGVFRTGGVQVQQAFGAEPQTLTPPITAKLFPMFMMMGLMILIVNLIIAGIIGAIASDVYGNSVAEINAAQPGSSLLGDLGTVNTFKAWLEPFKFVGLATILVGISLAVHTILQVIRFQGQRIRELAAGR